MNKYLLRLKILKYKIKSRLFSKVVFQDKFGLKYFLWKDTRLSSAILKGVRTDDEGVIFLILLILDKYKTKRLSTNSEENNRIIAFDVGAYIGVITLAIAKKLSATDQLFSFEPAKRNFQRLCENIKLNQYENNIYPIHCGVSNQDGVTKYLKLKKDLGDSYLVSKEDINIYDDSYEKIPTVSVTKYCERKIINKIDILKIDAEGYDLKVLQGAKSLIENDSIYYIFIECQHLESKDGKEIIAMLTNNGYSIFYIVRDSASVIRQLKNYPYNNSKPPLNIFAISPNAPFGENELNLPIVDK